MNSFDSFDDFFRYYISQHSKPATRWVHFASTHAGAGLALAGILRRRPGLLLAAPLATYGPAFLSHWFIEGNSPVTLKGNVLWAMRGDLRMIWTMWRGRNAELTSMAQEELARHAEGNGEGPTIRVRPFEGSPTETTVEPGVSGDVAAAGGGG
jgi:hypothetical protein